MRSIFKRWAAAGILLLIGLAVDLIPSNNSWIPSIVMGAVAFVWAIGTLIYWLVKRKQGGLSQFAEQVVLGDSPSIDVKTPGPVSLWNFHTRNAKNRTIGDQKKDQSKIQAIRFVTPVEITIRENQLPKAVNLEPKLWNRLLCFLFGGSPRIIVKRFTGKEILFDEESTWNQDVNVEFYITD